jgi:Mg-chelatase subunit ChlD
VDVTLVIDVSSSMLRQAGDGGTKLDAVLRASRAFLDHFDPEATGGRVAITVFNHRAWQVLPLSDQRAALDAALDRLPALIEEGTRLDLGLLAGADTAGDLEPGRLRVMVFLTDGLPNRVPTPESGGSLEETVLAAAAEVRARGIEIHTVGYGREDAPDIADRISPELLRAIAGSDARYHETDDAGVLADLFREIAAEIGCPEERRWPGSG